jgi:hypothetical protein
MTQVILSTSKCFKMTPYAIKMHLESIKLKATLYSMRPFQDWWRPRHSKLVQIQLEPWSSQFPITILLLSSDMSDIGVRDDWHIVGHK